MMGRFAIVLASIVLFSTLEFSGAADPPASTINLDESCANEAKGAAAFTAAPSANSCDDVFDTATCKLLFPTAAAAGKIHNKECLYQTYEAQAAKCAKTCNLCCLTPAFTSCQDDKSAPPDYCKKNAGSCSGSTVTANVTQKLCKSTCGLCLSGAAGCQDTDSTCADNISLCKNVDFIDMMRAKCAATCNLCTSSNTTTTTTAAPGTATCTDTASNCVANAGLCNNAQYTTLMTQKCAKTCGRCSGSTNTNSASCVDTNANCATWARNRVFCTDPFYANSRSQCAKSCNLCTSG